MNIDPTSPISLTQMRSDRSQDLLKDKSATEFEEIFARHLVKEMTKGAFEMSGGNPVMGKSSSMYREFITDALAGELAKQRKLGMADLVSRYWNNTDINEK
jgi:Rod binding domain-containing protein